MTAFTVRPMRSTDFPAIMAIQSDCYTELVPESQQSLTAKFYASPDTCFVATNKAQVVGYLFSLPIKLNSPPELNADSCELASEPDCLYLHDLAVLPSARKLHIGRSLIEQYLKCFYPHLFDTACLIAVQNSTAYWQKFGFSPTFPTAVLQQKLAGYGEDAVYMMQTKMISE